MAGSGTSPSRPLIWRSTTCFDYFLVDFLAVDLDAPALLADAFFAAIEPPVAPFFS
jgi:hypothetical protein